MNYSFNTFMRYKFKTDFNNSFYFSQFITEFFRINKEDENTCGRYYLWNSYSIPIFNK